MKDSELTKLAIASISPFDPKANGVTLPTGFCPNNFKASAVIRIRGVLNANGDGVINVNPSPYSNATYLWVSGAGFNTTFAPFDGSGPSFLINNYQSQAFRAIFVDLNPFTNAVALKDPGLTLVTVTNLLFTSDNAFIDRINA